jgi:sialate O-acetylesterase
LLGLTLAAALLTPIAQPATNIAVPQIFAERAVLQRDAEAPVWGTADPGGIVTVSIAGRSATAEVDARRNWRAVLRALPAGGPYTLRIAGANAIEVPNVLVGDVYIASGQSNMSYAMTSDPVNAAEAARMNDAGLRQFWPFWFPAATPQPDFHVNSLWLGADEPELFVPAGGAKKAAYWCAICYYFGTQLRKEQGVPIGIIAAAVGATSGQTWLSLEALSRHPVLLAQAQDRVAEQRQLGHETWPWEPGVAFNAMINPIVGYGVKGVLWYQGELKTGPGGEEYGELLTALIADWRARWGQELPFYIVQLPGFGIPSNDPNAISRLAFVREGQMRTAVALPKAALAITIDLDNPSGDLHPVDKVDVGLRLARLVLHGQTGPIYSGSSVARDGVEVRFAHADGGLVATGGPLQCFAIAGAGKRFEWASAQIRGDTVVVSSPAVPNPVAVRYAWGDNPRGCNLHNGNALPASPFRTDAW